MKKIIFIAFSILFLNNLFAQVPNSFKYQAVVRDASGQIMANKLISLKISILQDEENGSAVYSEEYEQYATNDYGIVSVNVGTGVVVLGNFNNIRWGEHSYYMKVELDINGQSNYVLMGTSQILAVPYAIYALDVINNDDDDADPTNEIQDLQLINNVLTITNNGNPTEIELSQYVGTDTDDQTLSLQTIGNTVQISISEGNDVSFNLPTDFVSRSGGGTFLGPIYATNIQGLGRLSLAGNLTLSGTNPVQFTSTGESNLILPTSGTLATTANSMSNSLPTGNIWVGVGNVATPLIASGTGQILIGNGGGLGSYPINGDASISSIGILTLTNTGVSANTYRSVTVDSKGRVMSGTNPTTLGAYGITDAISTNLSSGNIYVGNSSNIASQVTLSGDASLSNSGILTLANTSVVPGTYFSMTVDSKGRITNGTNPTTLAGFGISDGLSRNLNNRNIYIGNGSDFASQVVMSGDATLENNGVLTLANTTVTPGTYRSLTVDSKGRVTAGTNPTTLSGYGITDALSVTLNNGRIIIGNNLNQAVSTTIGGDATLTFDGTLTLANSGVTANTYRSVTVDSKGRVTSGTNPTTLSGYGITDALPNTLANGSFLIGNISGIAIPVTMSGDATMSNSGLLTLANSGVTANTYRSVTVDLKGRVTSGTNPTTLSEYGITDAMGTTHPAYNITADDISNWNTAYGWGNHASAGYLTASSWASPGVIGSGNDEAAFFTTVNISEIIHLTPVPVKGDTEGGLGDVYVSDAGNFYFHNGSNWVQLN